MLDLRRRDRPAAGVRLDCLEAGREDGPLVFLLHGFPEDALSWRPQIVALAEAGFRVVAPDQRGYAQSDKPWGVGAYRLDVLGRDIAALAADLGRDRYDLVGHDWGGVVAWWVAANEPVQVRRMAILNAPHPGALAPHLRRSPSQLGRSAYIAAFQIPALPEALLRADDFRLLSDTLRRSSRAHAFSDADLARYKALWRLPGALTAMLNWYRALTLRAFPPGSLRISARTLIVWGAQDRFLQRGLATQSLAFCDDGHVDWMEQATHWLHHEEGPAVNTALVRFLSG